MQIFLNFVQGVVGIIVGGFLGIMAVILIIASLYFMVLWIMPIVMKIWATITGRRRR